MAKTNEYFKKVKISKAMYYANRNDSTNRTRLVAGRNSPVLVSDVLTQTDEVIIVQPLAGKSLYETACELLATLVEPLTDSTQYSSLETMESDSTAPNLSQANFRRTKRKTRGCQSERRNPHTEQAKGADKDKQDIKQDEHKEEKIAQECPGVFPEAIKQEETNVWLVNCLYCCFVLWDCKLC